jgi:hypothetical protein
MIPWAVMADFLFPFLPPASHVTAVAPMPLQCGFLVVLGG